MATYDELMAALRKAHAAGDTAGARELARRAEVARHALPAPPVAAVPQDAPSPGAPMAETMVPALDQIAATMASKPPVLPGMEASPVPPANPRITAPAPVRAAVPTMPAPQPAAAPPSPGPAFDAVGRGNPGSLMDMATIAAAMTGQPAPAAPRAALARVGPLPGQPVKGAAGGPAEQPAAAIDPATGQPYTPVLEALAAEIGNVPERLMRAGQGYALSQAELDIPAALGQVGILKDYGAGPEYIDRARGAVTDAQRRRRDAQAEIDRLSADMTQVNPAPGLDQAVVSGVSSFFDMAPGLAATLVTRSPLPMMAYLTAYSKGGTYADKRAEGVAPAKANTAADLYAMAEAIPEMLPLGVLLERGIGPVAKIGGAVVSESVSEAVTSGLQSLIDIGVLDARTTWGDAMGQAGQAAAAGGVMGLLSGSGAVIADKATGRAKAERGTPADPNAAPAAPAPIDQIALAMTAPPEAPAQPAADAAPVAPATSTPVYVIVEGRAPLRANVITNDNRGVTIRDADGAESLIPRQDIVDGVVQIWLATDSPSDDTKRAADRQPAPPPSVARPPAPQRVQPTPISRADAEADPGRYEIIGQSEGTGADWRDTGAEVVLDKTTGHVHPLATGQAAPPKAAAPEPAAPPAAQPAPAPQPTAAAKPTNQPTNFEFLNAQDVQNIGTEPGVMQYKAGGDAEGVTDRLKGVTEWRPERAGVSVVYEYADGRRVIADGHQRLGLAKRLAAQGKPIQMPVMVLRQADGVTPGDARVTAALKNIAEGSGTALDAAKVLRGSKQTVQDMALPPGSAIVRDAMGMRDLSDAAFGMVVNGVASERDGGIVGRVVTDRAAQANILGLLSRMQKDRPITAFQAEQVARQAAADTVTETQDSLFGPESDTKNLYLERAKIIEAATRMKREELRAFKNVVENADRLEAAGNQLDADANQSAVDSAARLRDYLSREANTKGPISDALTEAARALNGGASIADATRQFLAAVERVAAGGLVRGQPAQGGSARPGGDQGSGAPDAQRDPEPGQQAPVDAGADLFAPPQIGKSPDQVRAEAEATVRAQQSMIRKPGGNSGDAGPLFDTQGDLLAQGQAKPDPRAALMAARDKALAPYTQPDDAKFDAARGSKSLFGTDADNELLDALVAAKTLDAKRKAAEAWVLKQGRATGREHLVVLDKDGTPLSVDRGSKNGVSPTSAVWTAGAHGKVAVSIHNHPSSSGLSGGDLAMAAIWPHTMIVLGHNGDRHQITGTPAFDRSSGYRQATAQNRSADYFGTLKDALAGLRLVSDDRLSSARNWTVDNLDVFQTAARPLIQLVLDDMGLITYDRKAEWRAQFDATGLDYRGIYEPVSSSGDNRLGRAGWVIPARGDQSDNRPDGGRAEAASPGPDGGNRPPSQAAGTGGKQGDKPKVSPPKTKMDADFDAAMDALFGKDNGDVSSTGNDLERGGGDGAAGDGVGGGDVPASPGRDDGRDQRGTRKGAGGNRKPRAGGGVSGGDAALLGTGGNPAADGSGGTDRQPAPGGDGRGRDGNRAGGLSPDAGGNQAAAGNASGQSRPRLTPAERAAILKNALKEDIAEWAASRAGMAEEEIDPVRYDQMVEAFVDGLEGVNVAQATDSQLFMAMAKPLMDFMTREELTAIRPYFYHFLLDLRAGRVSLTQEPLAAPKPTEAPDAAAIQAQADKTRVVFNDRANIDKTLPLLLPEQRDDVAKIEARFARPDGHGMMITNGTGTGKTYTGMGTIKRFVQAGKKDILILAPSDAVIAGWVKTGDALGVPVYQLSDKKDAGQGVTVTTYANASDNNALASRTFDLIVPDEAQNLMSNADGEPTGNIEALRAFSMHPRGLGNRWDMQHAEDWAKAKALPKGDRKDAAMARLYDQRRAAVEKWATQPRSKVLFLSATPWAYDKTVDYTEGYLFSYPEDQRIGNSNQTGRAAFFVQNFGYRIRYHKLTKPEHAVDSAVFERDFHEKLKREGVLSGRSLQIDVDYDRRFVRKDDMDGNRLDDALEALDNLVRAERDEVAAKQKTAKPGERIPTPFAALQNHMRKNFDYLERQKLLEAIKARMAVAEIEKHLALGRKVVVFHDFNVGGGLNPFTHLKTRSVVINQETGETADVPVSPMTPEASEGYRKLVELNPWIAKLNFNGYTAPIKALPDALGKRARLFNGTVPTKQRQQNLADFNTDGSGVDVLVVQADAGGAGISMHDTTGKHQRVLINLGMPTKPTTTLQQEGRILRVGTKTNAPFRYFTIGTGWEREAFAKRIAERSGTVENLALGNEARDLMNAFIDAYMDAADFAPSAQDGIGGKAKDSRAVTITPYERAKSHYFGRPKITGRRDQRDGVDFYATPEPLGLKMVEWAGIRANERVLEPSAGDGAIARYMPDDAAITLVEPSTSLGTTALLRAPKANLVGSTFENYYVGNKQHVIVMNPPFGSGGATAVAHLAKAARHLRPGGRIVALIPTGPAADKRFDAWWESDDAKALIAVADVALPAVAFERAGTGVMTRVVVIDKAADPKAERSHAGMRAVDLTGARTVAEFFDRLENVALPMRPAPTEDILDQMEAEGEDAATPVRVTRPGPALVGEVGAFERTTWRSTKGKDYPAAFHKARVERELYDQLKQVAERFGGWFGRGGARSDGPTFAFRTEAAREQFIEATGRPTVGMEETAYHGGPHDFDRFGLEHIGKGEGAQAYGWGLYFASRRGVAEWYRDKLSGNDTVLVVWGERYTRTNEGWQGADGGIVDGASDRLAMDVMARAQDAVLAEVRLQNEISRAEQNAEDAIYVGNDEYALKDAKAAIGLLQSGGITIGKPGRLYTVDIPGPDNLMDWDAQIVDQPKAVKQAMRGLMPHLFNGGRGESLWTERPETSAERPSWRDQFGWMIVDFRNEGGDFAVISPSGANVAEKRRLSDAKDAAKSAREHFNKNLRASDAYMILAANLGSDRAASEALRAAGIPGHRYLDGGSRGAGDGSHNYVIYDDAAITIIQKEQRAELTRAARSSTEEIRRLMPALRAELDRLDLKRVKLTQFEGQTAGWQGMFQVTGDGEMEIIIGASLDPMKTLHHEVIHALRAMNLFTPEEWRALKLAAHRSWYQKHNIQARYSKAQGPDVPLYSILTAEQELEEAIAEEFSEALSKREAPKGGLLVTAFNKIARILRAFRNVLNGAGFQTTEDIFGRILAGEIGKRNAANTGARVRFQRKFDAAMGDLFAPPAEPAKSGMTDAQRREMEARAMQSKMRKTGGNSGDAGPLFSDDRDLFGDRLGFNENPPADVDAFAASLKADLGLRDLSLFMTRQGDIKVNMIAVDRAKQGQGIGTAAMARITDFADKIGARVVLSPGQRDDGFGTTSRDRLVRFYKRFGFVENKGRNKDFAISEGMYRAPRPALSFNENPPFAVRPLTPYGRAVRNNAMGATPFVPDRRVWETLTRANAPIWQRLRDLPGAASDAVDRARYVIQDRFLPVLRAQEAVMFQTGKPLPPEQDAYNAETTFSGKVGRHLLDIDERFTKPIIEIMAASRGRMTTESVGDWLYARHAQERNAYIASINPQMPDGGSGMTDAEAQTILSVVAGSPEAAAYDRIGQLVDGLRDWSITLRKDAGLISDTQEATWRNQYAHYVPLKGWEETDHQESVLSMMPPRLGRRFSIRGQETQRALGRTSEAFNPLQASITMAQEVAIRAEKNRVAQTIYNLAAAHPSEALWKVKTPKQKQYFNRTTGLVETRIEQPVTMGMDPNEMAVKIGGKEHRILFMDERIARAAGTLGPDQMSGVMRVLSIFSRFFSMTRTMLNPEFMITNAFRDFQTAQFNVQGLSELDRGKIAKAMAKNWRKAFLGVMRGQTYRFDTEWSRYFDEFQKAGAQVWFWTMENPTAAREHLARRIDLARGTRAKRMLRAMTSPSALLSFRDNPALAYIERVNMAVDNAIRLAAFVEARKQGMPVEKAAFLAKELTVNFNRRGEAGPQMNALYPFFNAAIQGTIRTGKALSSRRVAGMVLTAFAGGLLLDLINAALSDRDEDDELFYDKVPNYRSERNLHFVLWGKGDDPLAIPMPYGYNIFPYAGQQLGKVIRGVKAPDDAMADVAAAVFGAYSPINAATPAQMISPFIADPIVEMAENKNGLGRPIYPQDHGNQTEPDAYVHFRGATEASKWVAQSLNALTGGDFRESGFIDVSPETLDHLSSFVVGSAGAFWGRSADMIAKTFSWKFDQIEGRNVPFLRTIQSPIGEWTDRDRYYRFGAEVKNAAADKLAYEAAGVPVPKKTAALAGLYDAWLAAERERNGKGEWNPKNANKRVVRPEKWVFLDFNRKYIAVMGRQGE